MGSSKKRKKHKSERREKYEEYSNNMDPSQLQRGLKLILKVGGNNTPEYMNGSANGNGNGNGSGNSLQPAQFTLSGPPTAAQAMCSSPLILNEMEHYRSDKHKKSKKKKKKKDREKKHKHHKEKKKDKSERCLSKSPQKENSAMDYTEDLTLIASHDSQSMLGTFNSRDSPKLLSSVLPSAEADSSQGDFSFIDDDNSQPLAENMLFFAGITTDSSPSCRPISKPIKPNKPHELTVDSSTSNSIQSSSLQTTIGPTVKRTSQAISPSKPLSDVIVLSPTASMSALTPGSGSISTALSPKTSEAGRTPNSSSDSGREPRTCVLKLKQQKSPLNKLLEHLLRGLEKRDPHQFFAWPVTDDIAPGYSSIISKPMDFSTMRQKIDDNVYATLGEFTDDFRLMCENAIKYNHVDTVYHKAAKRLLQVGMKHLSPETLTRSLKSLANYLKELTVKELGFELNQYGGGEYNSAYEQQSMIDSADEGASTGADEPLTQVQLEAEEKRKLLRLENLPKTRFEPFVDDMTSEEILAQVQGAAQAAKKLLTIKENAKKIGFLRQNKDGTTSLNILIKDENSGPEKVINLGDVVGRLKNGSGQTHYYREDKRNEAKLVKPLHYGPFASFAPTFDSRFSTLNKEETQLVMQTYGDATSTEYAESILQFTKDSNYASMLANGLLDVLTNGEHSKCMEDLYDLQFQNYEQQEALKCFNNLGPIVDSSVSNETKTQIEQEYENYKNIRIDFNRLRTLSDLGIEIDFLDDIEKEMKNFELTRRLQEHLSNNLNLIHKLRNTQHERLSQPLPHHLAFVSQPSQEENQLANQLTQQLIDAAKNLPPSAIAEPYSLRKAMGLSYVGLPAQQEPTTPRLQIPPILQTPVSLPNLNFPTVNNQTTAINMAASLSMDLDEDASTSAGGDLENELREFLESGSDLHVSSTNPDDNLVAQLLMN